MSGAEFWLIAGGAALALWAGDVFINPKAPCRGCQGHRGRHGLSRPKAYGDCRRCGGRGERLRFGARWVRRDLR